MDDNTSKALNKLMPEQEERLRTAMRILLDYLLENGYLAPNAYLTKTLSDRKQQQEKLTTSLPEPDHT